MPPKSSASVTPGSKKAPSSNMLVAIIAMVAVSLLRSLSWVDLSSYTLEESMDEEVELSVVAYEKLQQQLPAYASGIQEDDTIPSRIFLPWKNWTDAPLPCILDSAKNAFLPKVQRSPSKEGLLFIKIEKAASTTAAGVAARIAHKMARKVTHNSTEHMDKVCTLRLTHLWSSRSTLQKVIRDPEKSFAFTFVKEPTKRVLSMFYFFFVARASPKNKQDPTDENVKNAIQKMVGSQVKAVHLTPTATFHNKSITKEERMQAYVEEALNDLNFIGIVERLDESIVLLQLMLDLDTSDVLFAASSKQTGGYTSNELGGKKSCSAVPPYNISKATKDYIQSEEWQDLVYWENLLYKAVHKSMDRTIQAIGEDKFQTALQKYRDAMKIVKENCNPTVSCSPTGEFIPKRERDRCYWIDDIGCGYECLDKHFG